LIHFYKRVSMADRFGIDASARILFSLFYFIFSLGFVYQSKEFASAGISPESLLTYNDWIGSEEIHFFRYHMKRTVGSLVLHSFLPFGYLLGYTYFSALDGDYEHVSDVLEESNLLLNLLAASVLLPLLSLTAAWLWSLNDWARHPFVSVLTTYSADWRQVARDVEREFRRIDKFSVRPSPLSKLVVTDNWLVLTGCWPWSCRLSHQSDVSLQIVSSEQHRISTEGHIGGTQFLHIKVDNRRPEIGSFTIRVNALEYKNLQDKVRSSIENTSRIEIFRTVSERFVEVFRETVGDNETVSVTEELEPCIGCMVNTANVKLVRSCQSVVEGGDEACVNCYCRPMWCIDCMAKWFASRQDQSNPENWLGQRCPCPTCRSKFCVLDVRMIL